MNRVRVLVTYPNHAVYGEMTRHPASGVVYSLFGSTRAHSGGSTRRRDALRRAVTGLAIHTGAGLRWYQRAKWQAAKAAAGEAELLHCCGHAGGAGRGWVGDYENVNVLSCYDPERLRAPGYRAYLEERYASPDCRAIRVWSAAAARSFRAALPSARVADKLRVIYPTLPAGTEVPARRRGGPLRLLFIGRGFVIKGGRIFLDAIAGLRGSFDLAADFICDLPPEFAHYRANLAGTVTFHEPTFSRAELRSRFYSQADVFVMLGMADSYGLALLEAASCSLPSVAFRLHSGLTDLLALTGSAIQADPKYQIFGPDGVHAMTAARLRTLLAEDSQPEVVARVQAALTTLLADRVRREELGARGRRALAEGPLSLDTMREQLGRLYREGPAA